MTKAFIPLVFLLGLMGCVAASPDQESPAISENPETSIDFVAAELAANGTLTEQVGGDGRPGKQYQAGSIAKLACTFAALDMAEEGLISLDASIAELLPGFTGRAGDEVTLLSLLQNRSGLQDELMTALRADMSLLDRSMPALAAANEFAGKPTEYPPGTAFNYVNSNWVVVQAILEHVDGRGVATVLDQRVFRPAGLENTEIFSGSLPGPDPVPSATPNARIPDFVACAGGLASTPADLVKLLRYPYTGGLNAASQKRLMMVTTPEEGYTIGGRVNDIGRLGAPHVLSWQSGSNGDFKSVAVYDPITDRGYAIMSNTADHEALEVKRDRWLETLDIAE